jgi:hypothetical protein
MAVFSDGVSCFQLLDTALINEILNYVLVLLLAKVMNPGLRFLRELFLRYVILTLTSNPRDYWLLLLTIRL